MNRRRQRCAIYTRKSSDEGLEQSFNSLDAQREACAAYIASQTGEGWVALTTRYDDGGVSGGTMERPALKRLMADISACKVDTVVVYKIDRLTRSLADFARMVEVFEQNETSFVSVTQAFSTTSSMGRLTLNVLLSFAQFEREVTGERIRDKIAASKKKGMWMGGNLPLGYDAPLPGTHRLRVNPDEAAIVRDIFSRYLDLGSVHELERALRHEGIVSKVRITAAGKRTGGHPFSRGALFHLLRNRLYLGEITHRDASWPGLHEAIIKPDLFEAVRLRLDINRRRRQRTAGRVAASPLAGRIFDDHGHPMSPTFAYGKSGRLYRYYVSAPLQQGRQNRRSDPSPRRLSADRLETCLHAILGRLIPAGSDRPLDQIIRLDIRAATLELTLPIAHLRTVQHNLEEGEQAEADPAIPDHMRLTLPAVAISHRTQIRIETGAAGAARPDATLIRALRDAHAMLEWDRSSAPTLDAAPSTPHRRRLIRLAFLAPDLQKSILEGRQPQGLTLARLMKDRVPLAWNDQYRLYGQPDAPDATQSA